MKHQAIKVKDNKYYLNQFQWFMVQKDDLKKRLSEIQFPAIVLDTEFFNQSHNQTNLPDPLYNEKNPSLVYVLQYSFVNSLKEIFLRSNRRAIKSLTIKRKFNDPKYDFNQQYEGLIRSFIQMCINKKIQTIIVSGASNDKTILQNWVNNHQTWLKNKSTGVFQKNGNGNYELQIFDIYDVLEKTMAFSNFKSDGSVFSEPKHLKKGNFGENTIQIPSLKRFFDYFAQLYQTERFEDNADIYKLCVGALRFYSLKTMSYKDFLKYNEQVKQAKFHCFNDVLKTLYMLKFWYSLLAFPDDKNKYLKIEKSKK